MSLRNRYPHEIDDTARIQEAISAGERIPAGDYVISSPIKPQGDPR